jgi:hypothetical protein
MPGAELRTGTVTGWLRRPAYSTCTWVTAPDISYGATALTCWLSE